jgi:predicted DNA-binding transcriptional regulator AlpA
VTAHKKTIEPKTAAVQPAVAEAGIRLLTKRELLDLVKVSYPTIWQWMRDGKFPRSRSLGVGGQKIVWLASEVESWMTNLPVRELKGDAKKTA